jgi:polysaccharide biosynthesis protein PslH
VPYPLTDGGKVRVFNLIKRLSKCNSITLICYIKDKREETGARELAPYLRSIRIVKRRRRTSMFNLMKYVLSLYPSTYVINGFSGDLSKMITEEIKNGKYDLVQVEHFYMAEPVSRAVNGKVPMLLIEHNIEYKIYELYAKYEKNLFKKLFYMLDSWRMKRTERKLWGDFDGTIFMSKDDEGEFKCSYPSKRSYVVPNGVDLEYYAPAEKSKEGASLVFLGNFKYQANIDALEYFIREIYNKIVNAQRDTILHVFGDDPLGCSRKFSSNSIKVHGYVEDIRPFMNSNNIFVAPIRAGGGIKLKVLEAMSMGMPVVGTSLAFAGIEHKDNLNCMVADSPEAFAAKIIELYRDGEMRRAIGKNARELVKRLYNWDVLSARMREIYKDIGGSR